MTPVDYARIHLNVAVKVWKDSPRWVSLFPTYPHYCELRVDAESLAYDLAVAAAHTYRPPSWIERHEAGR